MPFLRKYNTLLVTGTTAIRIPIIKRDVVDFAVGADWTPAAGDVKVFTDAVAVANITNLPTAIASGNTAQWEFILTAAELSGKQVLVMVADAAAKAVEDQAFIVETFGHASAMYAADLSLANLPANVTQLLGTAWLAPGVAGTPDVNTKLLGGTAQTGRDVGASVLLSAGAGAGQLDFAAGVVKANLAQILGTALTETAGQIAAAFKKVFDVAAATFTALSVNQTGDNFARLGAPAGASVSADVAAVKVDTAAILVDTGTTLDGRIPAALIGGRMAADVEAVANATGGIARFERGMRAITTFTIGAGSTTTDLVLSAIDPAFLANDQFKGLVLAFDKDTTTANLRGQKTTITTGNFGTQHFTVTALTDAPVNGDTGVIM